jgi:NDP-4-keto-2,6-dideoxyhexose 3-C-methyltransferase
VTPDTPPVTERTTCRSCDSAGLIDLFSLGAHYVSDFVPADKIHSGVKCPVELVLCPRCALVQLRHTAPQELLYRRHYHYRSDTTATMRAALKGLAETVERAVDLRPGDVVCDIGSNVGTLLRSYTAPGIVRVGVEPALNFAGEGAEGAEVFISDFWSARAYFARMIDWKYEQTKDPARTPGIGWRDFHVRAKAVTAAGVMYDLDDINSFVADVARVLHPGGVFVAQITCLKQTVELNDVSNLCHEHLLFPSLESLSQLFARHGLAISDVEENAVNGGSYRLFVRHHDCVDVRAAGGKEAYRRVVTAFRREAEMRLHEPETYRDLYARMCDNRDRLMGFVKEEVALGKRVHVLGASTKGNTILQFAGLDRSLVEAASERDSRKVGKYTVGTGIPIVSEEESRRMRPDVYLALPYAFAEEMIARERKFLAGGGAILVPLPDAYTVRLIDGNLVKEEL